MLKSPETPKEHYTFRLECKKKEPKPNAAKYYFETINDVWQAATLKNHKRLFKALKDSFEISLRMEECLKSKGLADNPDYVHKRLGLKGFEWIDD